MFYWTGCFISKFILKIKSKSNLRTTGFQQNKKKKYDEVKTLISIQFDREQTQAE